MFRKDLKDRLEKIFGVKVTFNEPGSFEQNTLFVAVENASFSPRKDTISATVRGDIILFAQFESAPFGFFATRINKADRKLTRPLTFFELDTVMDSQARIQNIAERKCRFVFLFEDKYDPSKPMNTEVAPNIEQVSYLEDGSGRVVDGGQGTPIGGPT